jgi:4-aminobutyrate aminotransferase
VSRARRGGRAGNARPDEEGALSAPDAFVERHARFVAATFGFATDIQVVRAEGAWVEAADGRRYLDCASGIGCVNLGHNHPAVIAAAREQMERMVHSGGIFRYESMVALAERLAEITPGEIGTFFFVNGGGEAVEGAVKLCRRVSGRHGVVTFRGGFHGRTLGATSYTTSKAFYRAGYAPFVGGVHVSPFPTPWRWEMDAESASDLALRALDELHRHDLPGDETACYLVEPVQGEGGYHPAGPRFLEGLRERADRHGAMLVFDEVQTGFGRTGEWFAARTYGVDPDVICMAKGIANGFPVSAIGAAPDVMARWPPGAHGTTFGGNPIACAAGCATIDAIGEEGVLARARALGRRATERLTALAGRVPEVADVRGPGLMIGVELADPDARAPRGDLAAAAISAAQDEGVVVIDCGPDNNVIRFIPPLTLTDAELALALDGLERAIERAVAP